VIVRLHHKGAFTLWQNTQVLFSFLKGFVGAGPTLAFISVPLSEGIIQELQNLSSFPVGVMKHD
jgi:hypothetical protein